MKTFYCGFIAFIVIAMPFACGSGDPRPVTGKDPAVISEKFKSYWFAGKAEISTYELEQVRYGEVRKGTAVTIFVTEPFSHSKKVKLDNFAEAGADRIDVMKLNFTRNFNTGIYPYSVMTSVFTPVDTAHYNSSLKLTATCQEWCGHTFTQLTENSDGYDWKQFSYFEKEGDTEMKIQKTILEDEIWTMIRIAPGKIPTGKVTILPAAHYLRFSHMNVEPLEAEITHTEEASFNICKIRYQNDKRTVIIRYSKEFPHTIDSWEETEKTADRTLVSKGRLLKRITTDYWNQNSGSFDHMRKELGLER